MLKLKQIRLKIKLQKNTKMQCLKQRLQKKLQKLQETQLKKPKMYLPLKIYVKTYKNLHLSFKGRNFLWAGC